VRTLTESSVVHVEKAADRVEDVESCRLLWQRAGRQHRHTYWRRSLMWHGSRALLTAIEIPPSDYGHRICFRTLTIFDIH